MKTHSKEGAKVSLTFDDGWKSVYENAFPLLEGAGMKATFYIISGYLDAFQYPQYMNIEDIRDLEESGHEIGCHTVSHRHLTQEPSYIVEDEIFLSKEFLQQQGFSMKTFAYPYGEYDDRTISVAKKADFLGARSTIYGFNDQHTDRFLLRTQAVKADTSLEQVKKWFNEAEMNSTWLILMFHQIDEEGREWSSTPQNLKNIIEDLKQRDTKVVTVAEGLS